MKPQNTPNNPHFSSGPTSKRPGWSLDALKDASLGRSHRAKAGKAKLAEVIDLTRELLGIPADYHIGIMPGSDTGAFEAAMWSVLGARGVDVLSWESFGSGWATDVKSQLKLDDARYFHADYGQLPDLSLADCDRDVIFTWNGTTSGVKVPHADWIDDNRKGLTLCDATSAVFAMDLPWSKLDITSWSWQKVMGGEAAHGMLVLSPRAVQRLEHFTPQWPLPKIFRMTKKGKLIEGIFKGETINTPSMLCVEDALDVLRWMKAQGGQPAIIKRCEANLAAVADWVGATPWVDFLAEDEATRSCTSICLKIVDDWYQSLDSDEQAAGAKRIGALLEQEGAAFDIGAYRDAPPGLRLWGGATVEAADLKALFPWLEWAWGQVREMEKAA